MTEDIKTKKPKISSLEMDKIEAQFEEFDRNVKELTQDRMNQAPKLETEPQAKLSQNQIDKSKEIYLKPSRSIGNKDKFNEKFRDSYTFDREYVQFIAENHEIQGDAIEIWTRPYGGVPAEYWEVPVGKPVWGPRYLAEQIRRAIYHRLKMEDRPTNVEGGHRFYGAMAVDTTIQRLDARPISSRKSIFTGVAA